MIAMRHKGKDLFNSSGPTQDFVPSHYKLLGLFPHGNATIMSTVHSDASLQGPVGHTQLLAMERMSYFTKGHIRRAWGEKASYVHRYKAHQL